jgi:hypothetical protein
VTEFIQNKYESFVAAEAQKQWIALSWRSTASKRAVSLRSREGYKKSACEDLMCDF